MTKATEAEERSQMVCAVRRIATELGSSSVSTLEFTQRTGISNRKVRVLFGSYNALVEAAGLVPNKCWRPDALKYTNQELIAEMVRVLRTPNSKLTIDFFERNCRISVR